MEQRPLRLGDILDDYCPRERRVTNHAVVAMIEENVKQTRCTTCDAEHPYKGGQAPRRRRKEAPSALYKEVLAGKPESPAAAASSAEPVDEQPLPSSSEPDEEFIEEPVIEEPAPVQASAVDEAVDEAADEALDEAEDDVDESQDGVRDVEEGPVHRPLIRAQLPRPEGQKDARTPPDFTIRQSGGRGGNNAGGGQFRGGGGSNNRMKPRGAAGHGGNGHRPHGGPRFASNRPGQGQGQGRGQGGGGFRQAQPPRHGGGGKKRSR